MKTQNKEVILIRGLPGVGKSTLANALAGEREQISADDYFLSVPGRDDSTHPSKVRGKGDYKFVDTAIASAHKWCQKWARTILIAEAKVVIANTFTQRWEMEFYLALAKEMDARLTVIDLWDGGFCDMELAERNTHGVPVNAITHMRERYEHNWGGLE